MEEHKNYSKIQDTHISHMESGTGEQVIQAEITRNEKDPDPKAAQDPEINQRMQRALERNERKKEDGLGARAESGGHGELGRSEAGHLRKSKPW